MLEDTTLGRDVSYLRRLGALSGMLCGSAALLGVALVAMQPSLDNVIALLACAGLAAAGTVVARGN